MKAGYEAITMDGFASTRCARPRDWAQSSTLPQLLASMATVMPFHSCAPKWERSSTRVSSIQALATLADRRRLTVSIRIDCGFSVSSTAFRKAAAASGSMSSKASATWAGDSEAGGGARTLRQSSTPPSPVSTEQYYGR